MKAQWENWMAKFDALQKRERAMIALGVAALIWALFDTMMMTPVLNKQKLYRSEIAARQSETSQFQQQTQQMIEGAKIDPDAGNKQRLAELQARLAEKDAELGAMQQALISPDRMPRVLESLLQRDRAVQLVSLTTLPVSGLMEALADSPPPAKTAAPVVDFGIYKHGFEVKLEGGYLDLMRYVTALEHSSWHMLWGGMNLDATTYPRSTLTLTLYTLSLDNAWLSL